ncbi:MAG: 3-oxoacyl-ACP reductase FabG [Granulosicoccaceae bacterium]
MSALSLQEDVVLVTGASRGIGRAIAMAMANAGATVVGTATSDAGAAKITEALQAAGAKGKGMCLNVTDGEGVLEVTKAIAAEYGPITVLVNNAGITRDNLMLRMKDDEWDSIIDTNLSSVFRVTKACIKGMVKARRGRIINISSVVGATGNPGQANYAAAKAGLEGFSKSMAREFGARNITVNCIAPGFIRSDMTDVLSDEVKDGLMSSIALGRLGEPEEIAHAALFLASKDAAYVTGHTLHVNGGMYMA